MSRRISTKAGSSKNRANSLVRATGRVAIWILIGLLLVRGVGAVLAPAPAQTREAGARERSIDPASAAVAVRFARAYFDDPSPRALAPFMAEGASIGAGSPPLGSRPGVTQAELVAVKELGGGEAVLTVACDLRDARTLYLAVPISRLGAGGVAVLGAPWIVAAPGRAGVAVERPRPLAGAEASAIRALVEKFLPAYLSGRSARDLSYLLAPGAAIAPLGGSLRMLGSPSAVSQLGDGEGGHRTVVVSGGFRDTAGGAFYRLAYRLELVRRGRWYVRAVEGALS